MHAIHKRIYNDEIYVHEASVPYNAPKWTIKHNIYNNINNGLGSEYSNEESESSSQYIGKIFY